MSSPAKPPLNTDVFINCSFDDDFLEVFRAIVFAVKACGFEPRTALDVHDAGDIRIDKIKRLISGCDYGIHDLSAVALDKATSLPRFNMPLELGMSLGAKWYGGPKQKRKRILVLDETAHQYDISTSDISGQDVSAHGSETGKAITCVRNWLAEDRASDLPSLPGGVALSHDYTKLRILIDEMIVSKQLDSWLDLSHSDYLRCVVEGLATLANA